MTHIDFESFEGLFSKSRKIEYIGFTLLNEFRKSSLLHT